MSQQYVWMLALAAAWLSQRDDGEPSGPLAMPAVTARAGVLASIPVRSANDPSASIMLVLVLVYAKPSAKIATFQPVLLVFCANDTRGFVHPETLARPASSRFVAPLPGSAIMSAPPGQSSRYYCALSISLTWLGIAHTFLRNSRSP